jgi:spermidine/putrescine-binding protein
MSYGNSTIGSALNSRAFSLAATAAGFALSAAACDGRHPAAPATDVQVLNIYNWADHVSCNTIAEFERRVAASNDPG